MTASRPLKIIWIIPFNRENRAVRIALVAGLIALALALAARLSRAPLVLAGTNTVPVEAHLKVRKGETSFCQSNEVLPSGTSAIRLWISVNIGPRVTVAALSGSRTIAQGAQSAGWTGAVVTIPIAPVPPRRSSNVTVCIGLGPLVERIYLAGGQPRAGGGTSSKMRIEYLRPGQRSWWSRATSVAQRMGLGRYPSGGWIALVPLVLMAAAAVLTSWLILGQIGLRAGAYPSASPPIAGAQVASPPQAPVRPALTWPARIGRLALSLRAALGRVPTAAWVCASVAA